MRRPLIHSAAASNSALVLVPVRSSVFVSRSATNSSAGGTIAGAYVAHAQPDAYSEILGLTTTVLGAAKDALARE